MLKYFLNVREDEETEEDEDTGKEVRSELLGNCM